MEKVDLKKQLKEYYNPSKKVPIIVTVPKMNYLQIDGMGTTESSDFKMAIQALFSVSYKAKFIMKKEHSFDYVVMPLEGLWWAEDMNDFIKQNKAKWVWTLMIMQPEKVTQDVIDNAIEVVRKKEDNPKLNQLRLTTFEEGLSGQIMHIGPFSEEHHNIMRIHELIEQQGGTFDGHIQKHHEIYLSDFRKTAPEKLKTIIRQPFMIN